MKRIFCYGDSNTYGYDARSAFGERLPKTQRWTDLLQQFSGCEIINAGMNGRKIPRKSWALESFDRQLAGCGPADLIFIMLGTNDLLTPFLPDAGKICMSMDQFVLHVLEHPLICGKGEKLLLTAPPAIVTGDFDAGASSRGREAKKLGDGYKKIAERYGLHFADASRWELPLAHDGIHLTPEGHRLFAEKMWDLLKNIKADS
ncbi:MAG: GDSL-type esterase/lipase family protein [Enterocloster sp.]